MERVIFHIDVNSAFLSWEAVYRVRHLGMGLDLRDIPSAVGGDQSTRHGIILAKSLPAKKYGIKTGEPLTDAYAKCPTLMVVPPNYDLYERSSSVFMEVLRQYTPDVSQFSVDEAFMDMTGTGGLWGEPIKAAHDIKDRIRDELGFTVNVGVSTNKLLAKTASDFKKPDMVHTLYPVEIPDKLWPLPISELYFVGRANTARLLSLGIRTIGELAHMDVAILRDHFKKYGDVIHDFANGIDSDAVSTVPHVNKGYGNSTTIPFDVKDHESAYMVLLGIAETVGSRLRKDNAKAEVISVSIKNYLLGTSSHQMVMPNPTDITLEIYQYACRLFDELWDGTPIRLMGISTTRLSYNISNRQLDLFGSKDYMKLEALDRAIDEIRRVHGIDSIKRATFIKNEVDHLSGGVSRWKRSVDYGGLA